MCVVVEFREGGLSSADTPASSGSQWARLRNSMWGFGRLPILWTLDASSAARGGTRQAHKQPVNRFSTAESDFRCLTPRADDTTESYTSPRPWLRSAESREPRIAKGACVCATRGPAHSSWHATAGRRANIPETSQASGDIAVAATDSHHRTSKRGWSQVVAGSVLAVAGRDTFLRCPWVGR